MSNKSAATHSTPGFLQGLMLVLPITMPVVGVSIFTATVAQMQETFKSVPYNDYLINFFQTMPGIWIFLFSPVAGWLADRFGRRRILIWSMLVYALVGVAPYFLNNIYLILLTRCGVGLCESVVLTVTTTMLCDYFSGRTREKWLASQTGTASISALFIVPLGGYLGATLGWHGPFLVYLYSLILVLGIVFYCWEPDSKPAQSDVEIDERESRYTTLPLARLLGICAITVVASVMFYTTITQNANAFVALGVTDPQRIGVLSSYAGLGVPIGTVIYWGIGRLHIGWLLFIDFLFIGAGFIGMGSASDVTSYVWAANLQQIGCGLILPTLLMWSSSGLAYAIRGRGVGMWQGAFAVGFFFSGATLTLLGKQTGGLLPALVAVGKLSLVAAACALIVELVWRLNAKRSSLQKSPTLV